MAYKKFLFLAISFFATTCLFGQEISLTEAFDESFDRPVGLEYSHQGSSLLYIVQQDGIIKTLNVDEPNQTSEIWFDISGKIEASSEEGLLGLAFHPNYPENNTFYLNYTYKEESTPLETRISRFSAPNETPDPDSEEILMAFEQPRGNHNGGQLAFGPDGYLYIFLGDGGGYASQINSQDITNVYGNILRIDVNTESGYDIPEDNPFVNNSDGLDEIYSFGFRNPWRASFDPETGHMWVADVGETARESIYIVEKGKNYGWPEFEGTYCFKSDNCDISDIEIPVFEYIYDLDDTGRSITGGYVYRGKDNPLLLGKYIYGDFISGRLWALEVDHQTKSVLSNTELLKTDLRIPSFGLDSRGEIYIIGWGSSAKIYRFSPELTLTTLSMKSPDGGNSSVQLNWDVNRDSGIDSFEIFRGSSMDSMELYDTIGGNNRQFSDSEPLNGVTFYAIRAVETDGVAGELSNVVSYYRAQETLSDSWQLTSIPFETEGLNVSDAIIYSFDGSYIAHDQLVTGRGYWARSTVDGGIEFSGEGAGVQSMRIQLEQGWNLMGAPVSTIPAESIIDEGSILNSTPIYGFNGSVLTEAESISPGEGYWIYADEAGEIVIDLELEPVTLPLVTANKSFENYSETFDRIEFSSGHSTTELYAARGAVAPDLKNRFRVPPLSPNPVLDVRTADGFKLVENSRFEPEITVSEYPLSVRFTLAENRKGISTTESGIVYQYEITIWRDGKPNRSTLKPGESVTITEPAERIEFLREESNKEIVRQTELLPSYPNPFNPVTNITYQLSEQQQVTITVFDAAGRRISTLVNSEQEVGRYTLPFDASGLASGIYFVRFSAGGVLSTQKLTLIK